MPTTNPPSPRQDTRSGAPHVEARPAREPLAEPPGGADAVAIEMLGYSLSHDLRAPLRAIDGYLEALVEDYGSELPSGARDVVSRIKAASRTMEARVDALLRLSHLSRGHAPSSQACDLAPIATMLLDDLRRSAPGRRVEVTLAPAMPVEGDPALLGIVLENLLSNAWKYTRPRDPACIDVSYRQDPERVVVSVRDNGIGFDMTQVHRLGVPFQRLHAAPPYEGVGIGLASTMRILARHGGRLWAEGVPGQGATFSFSLPRSRTR